MLLISLPIICSCFVSRCFGAGAGAIAGDGAGAGAGAGVGASAKPMRNETKTPTLSRCQERLLREQTLEVQSIVVLAELIEILN